jgi:hypothetical protein
MSKIIAICALLLAPASAFAHHGGVSLTFGPGSPVETNSPFTLPEGGFVTGLRVEQVDWKKFSNNADGTPKNDNATSATFMNANFSYGFTSALMGTFMVPYYIKRQETFGANEGMADMKMQLTYGFHFDPETGFSRNLDKDTAVSMEAQKNRIWFSVSAMSTIPNGDFNRKRKGEAVPDTGMQTGFGAPAYTLGMAAARTVGPVTVNLDLGADFFTNRTDSSGDSMQYGTEVRADLAGVYEIYGNTNSFLSKLDGILELNFLHLEHDRVNGVADAGSGGDILYLSPGARFSFPPIQNANLGILCKFPVWTSLNDKKVNAQGSEGVENFRLISTLSFYF